jgi:hypothetical protein
VEHRPDQTTNGKPHTNGKTREIGRVYKYHDENGKHIFDNVRYKPKDFRYRRPVGNGRYVWNLDGIQLVLYHLPILLAAPPDQPVWIVEGEKDVENLSAAGRLATCNPMGAGKWRDHYSDALAGRHCLIIPDNDPPDRQFPQGKGRWHAQQVAQSLSGRAVSVKIVELPGLPEKGDVSDFLASGGTVDQLDELASKAPLWEPGSNGKHEANGHIEADPTRPQIQVTCDEHIVVDQALAVIKDDPALFQRGNALVMVTRASAAGKQKGVVERPEGSVQIAPMPKPVLRRIMSASAEWIIERTGRKGTTSLERSHVPGWAVDQLWELRHWPGVRHLEGVIEAPTMRPDGSLLTEPGYDDVTGLLFLPSSTFPRIPDKPGHLQAQTAAAELLAVVNDFPFASDEHRYGYLAALLTPLVRFAIDGPCPLFLLDANCSGSGKTKLSDIIGILASGRKMPRSRYQSDDAEMGKTLLSIALAGDRLVLFDNVPGGFSIGGGSLDAALTGTAMKGRILGESRMSGEVPLSTVFYASGNNLGLRGDALRRVVPVRLETTHDRPEERQDFTIEGDLLAHVQRERGRLVAAALTIVRAFVVAGKPSQGLTPMDYPAWCGLVRDAVAWCTGVDPCKARSELVASDEESTQRKALLVGFEKLAVDLQKTHLTVAVMLEAVQDHASRYPELHALFLEWGKDGKLASAKAIGRQFLKVRRRPIAGKCFDRTDTAIREWFVRVIKTP